MGECWEQSSDRAVIKKTHRHIERLVVNYAALINTPEPKVTITVRIFKRLKINESNYGLSHVDGTRLSVPRNKSDAIPSLLPSYGRSKQTPQRFLKDQPKAFETTSLRSALTMCIATPSHIHGFLEEEDCRAVLRQ